MKNVTIEKDEFEEICEKMVYKLYKAPFIENGQYVNLTINKSGKLKLKITADELDVTLAKIKYVFPNILGNNKRAQNWELFYEFGDFSKLFDEIESEFIKNITTKYASLITLK